MSDDLYVTKKTLIERAQDATDESAWAEFVEIYRPYIYTIIRRFNISHSDAEEITQQIFVKLLKKLPNLEYDRNSKQKFRSWLFEVTKNHTRDYIKSRSRHAKKINSFQTEEEQNFQNNFEISDIDRVAEEEWMVYLSKLAFERIRSSFRGKAIAAFEMALQGMSNQEIAEKLGVQQKALSTMKKRVYDRVVVEIKALREKYE